MWIDGWALCAEYQFWRGRDEEPGPEETADYDVHLMIESPDLYIPDFVTEKDPVYYGSSGSMRSSHRTVQSIKSHGVGAGFR